MVRTIPAGETMSYSEVAAEVGSPGAARAVGQALGRNPYAIVVPCHRVLAAGGRTGGFSATGGVATKLRMLAIEGVRTVDGDTGFPFDRNAAVDYLRASDAALARLIDRVGPFTLELEPTPSVFGSLAQAIVHQQLSVKAAATIYRRLGDLFPRTRYGFTAPDVLRASEEQLRGVGLSRAKVLALRDLAQRTVDGTLPTLAEIRRLDDDAIVDRLSAVRGIGRWSAEMFLIDPPRSRRRVAGRRLRPAARLPARVPDQGGAVPARGRAPRRALATVPHRRRLVPLAGARALRTRTGIGDQMARSRPSQ